MIYVENVLGDSLDANPDPVHEQPTIGREVR
jgi:hypothetical protein